jgi:hypothetical protein
MGHLAAATEDPSEDLSVFILNVATTHQVMDVIDAAIKVLADQMTVPGLQNCAVEAVSGFADIVSRRMKRKYSEMAWSGRNRVIGHCDGAL